MIYRRQVAGLPAIALSLLAMLGSCTFSGVEGLQSLRQKPALPYSVLITGGVHGYETSGVHGALSFLETRATDYLDRFNIACAPCVSPWAHETSNRWNPLTIDPNRSFHPDIPAGESAALRAAGGGPGIGPAWATL